jgi:hypothetical protein
MSETFQKRKILKGFKIQKRHSTFLKLRKRNFSLFLFFETWNILWKKFEVFFPKNVGSSPFSLEKKKKCFSPFQKSSRQKIHKNFRDFWVVKIQKRHSTFFRFFFCVCTSKFYIETQKYQKSESFQYLRKKMSKKIFFSKKIFEHLRILNLQRRNFFSWRFLRRQQSLVVAVESAQNFPKKEKEVLFESSN